MAQPSTSKPNDAQERDIPQEHPIPEPTSPLANFRARLSLFTSDDTHHHRDANDDANSDSEAELLLDPNLPADHNLRHQPLPRHSFSTVDEDNASAAGAKRATTSFDSEDGIPLTELLDGSSQGGDGESVVEDSPYPEVRAAVHPYDDPTLPCNTLRAWTIGLSLIFLGASMNTLFSLRAPSISLGALIAQVIAWPLGHGWARFVPERELTLPWPGWLGGGGRGGAMGATKKGLRVKLNPGPFNVKEHAVIVVMASVSFSVAYATDIIVAQKIYYRQDFGMLWQMLLTISTQSLGYGIAGMMRRFLGEQFPFPFLSMPLPVY